MQRSDLTIYEQAQGMQMLLDFGETIGDVARQTGFSETTIRRRVKLLDLDQDKFKKSVERGATLQDYAELDKIQDLELRNKVLESIGTANFQWQLTNALNEERNAKARAELIEKLKSFATQIETSYPGDGYKLVCHLCPGQTGFDIPVDAGEKKYYFIVENYGIRLLEEGNEPAVISELEARNNLIRERRDQLSEINKRAYHLRQKFVQDFKPKKQHANTIMEFVIRAFIEDNCGKTELESLFEMLGVEPPETEDDDDEFAFKDFAEPFYASPERVLLVFAYANMDSKHESFQDWNGRYERNRTLLSIYAMLERLGYPVSDEERAYIDGTHELFLEARRCRVCGCTDANACPGGCSWVAPDLCSACVDK